MANLTLPALSLLRGSSFLDIEEIGFVCSTAELSVIPVPVHNSLLIVLENLRELREIIVCVQPAQQTTLFHRHAVVYSSC